MSTTTRVRIPASTSNLGPGFDALSMALTVYLDVEIDPASSGSDVRIESAGVDSEKMPTGPDNLIIRVMDRVAELRKRELPRVRLRVNNQIPLARGMGSSSTAIIAGISCYEMLSGEELSEDEIFRYAFEFEPHPDNLAAALLGGLTVSALRPDGGAVATRLDVPAGIQPVLVIPDYELSTMQARSVLPETYSRTDAVFNIQRATLLVGALTSGKWHLLSDAMQDRIHQPYRAAMIPGLGRALSVRADGLMASALSGAGPTVLALARAGTAEPVGRAIASVFESEGVRCTVQAVQIDTAGREFSPNL